MKQVFATFITLAALLTAVSCSKEYMTPDELFKDSSKVAKTVIRTKGEESTETETTFSNIALYRYSDKEGQSWFRAFSGGKMVYDAFMLSIYFKSIDQMKVGETIKPSSVMFSFIFSSDSRATTHEYDGKITLAGKGDDYVILHFNRVRFNCVFGETLTNGYLYCPLLTEPELYY